MNENSSSASAPAARRPRSGVRPPPSAPSRYRRLAMLSLAVAVAAPVAVTTYNRLAAAEQPLLAFQQPTLAPGDALREGIRQYREGKFEEAVSTLQAVPADALNESDRKILHDTLTKADAAAATRKSARAEFELGQAALNNNRPGEAIQHYNNVINNRFVDEGTKQKAREQLAVAESQRKGLSGDLRSVYVSAVNDYKAGNLAQARTKFEQLQAKGYRPAMFQRSPEDYLREIARTAPAPQPVAPGAPGEVAIPGDQALTPPAPAPQPGVTPAPTPMPAQPGVAEATPAPAPTADSTPTPAPEPAQAPESRMSARQLYTTARNQYNSGDWINARKNFMAAVDAGYKSRLFEDSPQTYLRRMDRKEQQDQAIAARQAPPAPAIEEPAPPPPAPDLTVAAAPAPAPIDVTPAPEPAPAPAPAPAPDVPPAPVDVTPPPAPAPAPAPADVTPPPAPAPAPAPADVTPPPAPAPAPVIVQTQPPAPAPAPAPAPLTPQPGSVVTAPAPAPAPAPAVSPEQQLRQTAAAQGASAADNAARARQLVAEGRQAQERNDFQTALNRYSDAAALDPTNQSAQAGRNEMLTLTNRAAAPASPLDRAAQNIEARRQMIRYNFDTAIQQATQATQSGDFAAGQTALRQAQVAKETDPNIFTEEEVRKMNTELAATQLRLTQAEQGQMAAAANEQQRQTQIAIQKQRDQQEQERERTVADLRAQARRLISETRYQEALGVVDQILVLDAQDDYATGVRPLVEDKALLQQQRRFREDFDRQFSKQLNASEEKKIPYDDILRYPANWPDISEIRDASVAAEQGRGTADQATQAQLDKKLPELNFNAIPFADVVDFLRDVTGANIEVRWRTLETAGIDRNTPVTARLRDVRFSKALDTVLADVGGGTVDLGYTVDEGVISISTDEDLSKNTLTRVYDIRDLIIEVPDFGNAPTFNLQQQSNTTSGGGGGGGGGGQSLFGGGSGGQGGEQQQRTRQQLVEDITRLITETVAPESWRDAGGTVGSVRELQGQLIVTQTPENQRLLQGLLEQLRETRAIQVTVETRFLTVQRNYLEDVGFDVDVTLNLPEPGKTPGNWSQIPIENNSIIWSSNPGTGLPGSIRNVNNSNTSDVTGGGVNTQGLGLAALGISGTYLDNFAVQFLLRATQAAQMSSTVTAPRLTLFNGQRAYVLVSRQTAYVSDLEPVVAQNAVAFNPTIGLVQSGVLLDVQATVSSDRKYVTLTLRPQLATLIDLLPFTFQSDTQPDQGTTVPSGGGIIIGGGGTNNASGTIQQPILQITEVRTTVSVPDGGTLLLGGQTLAGEIEREAGVPILSKVPFLKRLFTNRSMAKDEQVLLILVKPTIVIQREQEQRQFPLLSTRITQ